MDLRTDAESASGLFSPSSPSFQRRLLARKTAKEGRREGSEEGGEKKGERERIGHSGYRRNLRCRGCVNDLTV